jgi:gamma-glutamyltranspeptidase/glutathione hydrolase
MRGAVAAGHPLTAEAGARILAEGGNAVDACVAAALVAWVAESPLTGPGAGGFMLVHRASDRRDVLLDFFVAVPGIGRRAAPAGLEAVDVPFGSGDTTQRFLIGAASCAVPGAVAGLARAHHLFGSVPWPRLVEPAAELAQRGVVLTPSQAQFHLVLDAVLRHEQEGRRIYGPVGPLPAGSRIVMNELASTLELLGARGAEVFYRGELASRIVRAQREGGGGITAEDLASYRVVLRRPVRAAYRGHELVSNPPPSSGGILIAYALGLLDRLGPGGPPGGAEALARLADVAAAAARVRGPGFARALHRGGLARRLLAGEKIGAAAAAILARAERRAAPDPAALPSTTHVSVLDADGSAASLSASTGCGSGVFVPGTGIHLNNMLGEADLNPPGAPHRPGRRLTSMMAPSILLLDGRPSLVIGSAGSERLRGAIVQTVVNVVDHGLPLEEAIERPRVHLDGDELHCEGGIDPGEADRLASLGFGVVCWPGSDRNLYFGGVSAVGVRGDGSLEAAGDPRRGGHGVVVPEP